MTTKKTLPTWWSKELRDLDGLPLLPCGAGDSYKAPLVSDWPNRRFSLDEVLKFPGLRCIGMRCGPEAGGLLTVDFDGESAIDYADDKFNFSLNQSDNWMIVRDSDQFRYKVVVRVPKSQWDGLPGKTIISTGPKEQIEFFWDSGQVIVAGEHVSSGDEYHWGGTSPGHVSEIPLSLFALWQSGVKRGSGVGGNRGEDRQSFKKNDDWRDCIPCPICGRTEIDCRISADGTAILCHRGSRWHPPHLQVDQIIERGGSY